MVNARSLSFSRPGKSKPSQDQSSLSAALDLASAPAADSPTLHRPSVTPQPPAKSGVKASPRTSWMARNLSFRASKKQLTPGEAAAEPPQQAITPSPPISLPPTAYTASAQLRTPIPVGSTPVRAASVEIVPAPAAPTSSSLAPPAVPDSSAPPLAPLDRARALATDAVPFELAPATEPATTDEAGDDEEEPSATETESEVASLTATNAELAQAVTVLQNEVEEAKGKLRSPDSVSSLSPESEEAKRVMSQVKIDAEARRLNEEKVASARKLAFDAAEKAAEAARLASMSEEELTNMQLGSKVSSARPLALPCPITLVFFPSPSRFLPLPLPSYFSPILPIHTPPYTLAAWRRAEHYTRRPPGFDHRPRSDRASHVPEPRLAPRAQGGRGGQDSFLRAAGGRF